MKKLLMLAFIALSAAVVDLEARGRGSRGTDRQGILVQDKDGNGERGVIDPVYDGRQKKRNRRGIIDPIYDNGSGTGKRGIVEPIFDEKNIIDPVYHGGDDLFNW